MQKSSRVFKIAIAEYYGTKPPCNNKNLSANAEWIKKWAETATTKKENDKYAYKCKPGN